MHDGDRYANVIYSVEKQHKLVFSSLDPTRPNSGQGLVQTGR